MDSASATEPSAAAEFRPGEIEVIAKHPEQRRLRRDVRGPAPPVDEEGEGRHSSPESGEDHSACRKAEGTASGKQKPDKESLGLSSGSLSGQPRRAFSTTLVRR